MDFNAALQQIDSWPAEERISFIEAAWDRLVATGFEPALSEAQKSELDRRIDDCGPLLSWEDVKASLRRGQ